MASKIELRAWARGLAPPTPAEIAAVVTHLHRWLEAARPGVVLTYLAMPGEIDVAALVAAHPEITWLVSRTPAAGWLTLHPLEARRERHRFGFEQPSADAPEVDPAEVEAALVPGLCFDPSGVRIGWGRGYFDELLGRMGGRATLAGVTLERRITDAIPVEPHDVRMDLLATERGVRPVRPRSG